MIHSEREAERQDQSGRARHRHLPLIGPELMWGAGCKSAAELTALSFYRR